MSNGPGQHEARRRQETFDTDACPSDPLASECELVKTAQSILARRRRRHDHFEAAIFGEPAWEMLLHLYIRDVSGASTTTSQLRQFAGVPAAERWLRHLEREGLVVARPHPCEPGTDFVELTNSTREALDDYLIAVRAPS